MSEKRTQTSIKQGQSVCLNPATIAVPEHEHWLHEPKAAYELQQALHWTSQHPASETRLENLATCLREK